MSHMTDILAGFRAELDETDAEILKLLAQRRRLAERIGVAKRGTEIGAYDHNRHQEVIADRMRQAEEQGVTAALAGIVFTAVLEDSVAIQEQILGGSGVPTEAELRVVQ
jgi:chorismate mutase